MHGKKQGILAGGVWTMAGRSVAAAGAIVMNGLIARLIPAEDFGAYVLVSSLCLFGSMVACAGLHRSSVRLIAGFNAKSQFGQAKSIIYLTLTTGLVISVVLGTLAFLVFGEWLAMAVFKAPVIAGISLLLLVWLILRTLQTLLAAILQGVKDLRGAVLVDGTLATLVTIAGLLIYDSLVTVSSFNGVMTVVVAGAGGGVLLGLALVGLVTHRLGERVAVPGREVLDTALPLFVATIALFGVSELHIWLLSAMKPEEDVALFGAARRLVAFVSFPLLVVNAVLPPYVASEFAKGHMTRLQYLLQGSATLCALPSMLIVIFLVFFAQQAMTLVYGSFYAAGAPALIALSLGHGLNVATGSPGILLAMSDRQSQLMWIALATGVTGIAVSFILIPSLGATGAAIGAGLGVALHNFAMWLYSRVRLNLRTEMSLTSLSFVYWRIRGRLTALRQDRQRWDRIDRVLARIERRVWSLRGYTVVECIGDSHTNIFNELNSQRSVAKMRFHVTAVRGATAFGLANPNSRTNAFQIFSATIDNLQQDTPVIFILGEVDLGLLIWTRAATRGLDPADVMQEALDRYIDFLETHAKGRPVAVVSAPLPTIGDGPPTGEVAKLRAAVQATQMERTAMTLAYNRKLGAACHRLNIRFVDLDPVSLDDNTKLVSSKLLQDSADHHYDHAYYSKILADAFVRADLQQFFSTWIAQRRSVTAG